MEKFNNMVTLESFKEIEAIIDFNDLAKILDRAAFNYVMKLLSDDELPPNEDNADEVYYLIMLRDFFNGELRK